ncbi:hypothetical protein OG539_33210 [Actinacidiphila glaucinigra]
MLKSLVAATEEEVMRWLEIRPPGPVVLEPTVVVAVIGRGK